MLSECVPASECRDRCGIVVEKTLIVGEARPINIAAAEVYDYTNSLIKEVIEVDGYKLKAFYIGRSFIDKNPEVSSLEIRNGDTWDLRAGVLARYGAHKGKEHCKNSLITIAALTNSCIPLECSGIGSGCFSNHHEYTLTLETRLRQQLLADDKHGEKLRKPSACPTNKSKELHVASVIYMTFTAERTIVPDHLQHIQPLQEVCVPLGDPGYCLYNHSITTVLNNETITNATIEVSKKIGSFIEGRIFSLKFEGSKAHVSRYYIGKAPLMQAPGKVFDPSNTDTWSYEKWDFQKHRYKIYGTGGTVVFAVVSRKSIPDQCYADGYITDQEEYASILEKRLIQTCKDPRLCRTQQSEHGGAGNPQTIAYAIYAAFAFGPPDSSGVATGFMGLSIGFEGSTADALTAGVQDLGLGPGMTNGTGYSWGQH